MKDKYTGTLQQIADTLLAKHHLTEEPGLLYGHAGMSLFLFHYATTVEDERYGDAAQQLLLEAYKMLIKKDKQAVKDEIPGIGWLFLYLTRRGLISIDTDELFESVDTFIFDGIQHRFSPVGGTGGLLSKGAYLTERYQVTASVYKKIMIAEVIASLVDEIKTKFYQGWPAHTGTAYDRYYSDDPQIIWQHRANNVAAVLYFLSTLLPLQIYVPIVQKLMRDTRAYLYALYQDRPSVTTGGGQTMGGYTALLRIYHALQTSGPADADDRVIRMAEDLKSLPPELTSCIAIHGIYQPVLICKLLQQLSSPQEESNWNIQAEYLQEKLEQLMNKRLAGTPNLGLAEGIAGAGMALLEGWNKQPIPWEEVLLLHRT